MRHEYICVTRDSFISAASCDSLTLLGHGNFRWYLQVFLNLVLILLFLLSLYFHSFFLLPSIFIFSFFFFLSSSFLLLLFFLFPIPLSFFLLPFSCSFFLLPLFFSSSCFHSFFLHLRPCLLFFPSSFLGHGNFRWSLQVFQFFFLLFMSIYIFSHYFSPFFPSSLLVMAVCKSSLISS